jgi:hypothetical protein
VSRAEIIIRRFLSFLGTDIGKATAGMFGAVLAFCFPAVPGYAVAAFAAYYAVHQFRPVAAWLYEDIKADLTADLQAEPPENEREQDGSV